MRFVCVKRIDRYTVLKNMDIAVVNTVQIVPTITTHNNNSNKSGKKPNKQRNKPGMNAGDDDGDGCCGKSSSTKWYL